MYFMQYLCTNSIGKKHYIMKYDNDHDDHDDWCQYQLNIRLCHMVGLSCLAPWALVLALVSMVKILNTFIGIGLPTISTFLPSICCKRTLGNPYFSFFIPNVKTYMTYLQDCPVKWKGGWNIDNFFYQG